MPLIAQSSIAFPEEQYRRGGSEIALRDSVAILLVSQPSIYISSDWIRGDLAICDLPLAILLLPELQWKRKATDGARGGFYM